MIEPYLKSDNSSEAESKLQLQILFLTPSLMALRSEGLTIDQIRDELNRRKVPMLLGRRWHVPTVHPMLKAMTASVPA